MRRIVEENFFDWKKGNLLYAGLLSLLEYRFKHALARSTFHFSLAYCSSASRIYTFAWYRHTRRARCLLSCTRVEAVGRVRSTANLQASAWSAILQSIRWLSDNGEIVFGSSTVCWTKIAIRKLQLVRTEHLLSKKFFAIKTELKHGFKTSDFT